MKQLHLIYYFVSMGVIYGTYFDQSELYQLSQKNITLESYSNEDFQLTIVSKYLPFGRVRQIGSIGLLDSNCMIFANIQGQNFNNTIFLYYVCIDQEEKQIQKFIQFIGSDSKIYNYKFIIPSLDYENHWYTFTFLYSVNLKMVFIVIFSYVDGKCYSVEDLMQSFIDTSFRITIGGGFSIEDDSGLTPFINTKQFSFFPGKLYYEITVMDIQIYDKQEAKFWINRDLANIYNYKKCQCESNYIQQVQINIQNNDIIQIAPEFRNCDKFSLQFWIKFEKIVQIQNEFRYQIFKMHSNSKDERLLNENLSAFQLFYMISKLDQNKIIFTTYSFDLPTVNLDFTQNQFLIKREYELSQDFLYSWQSISVVLDQKLNVQIKVYQAQQIISCIEELDVNHFHEMQFFMELGNLQKKEYDYINFYLFSFIFDNCETHSLVKVCHLSCLECDGPSKNDCLSCDYESNRIYLQQYKVCICPYNMVDNGEVCLNSDNLQLSFINYEDERRPLSCDYGYYQEDIETCIKCPSIIKNNKVTCLECILNPLSWKLKPVCDLLYILDDQEGDEAFRKLQSFKYDYENLIIYQFDGNIVTMCDGCNQEIDIYGDFQEAKRYFKQFCYISWRGYQYYRFPNLNPDVCYNYQGVIQYCEYLKLKKTELSCQACEDPRQSINGQCYSYINYMGEIQTCSAPNYINSQSQCVLCNILQCIFCFEYQIDDLNYSTLYKEFKGFSSDSKHSVGCALCQNGYQFNFLTGNCESQNIQIRHCLRSFINQKNEEICTLSDLPDFSLSPEIINCEKLIPNCLQCIKTPLNILQCVICKSQYCQTLTNNCEFNINDDPNAEICLKGESIAGTEINNYDSSRITLIQSFLMEFLPNKYYYSIEPKYDIHIPKLYYKCIKDYVLNSNLKCVPYCDSNCLECQENLFTYLFECKKCPLNYFKERIVSQFQGKCIECPQLCLFCQPRDQDQITLINPYFVVNENNEKYTYQCTKPIKNSNISIDNNLIASYNFQKNSFRIQYKIIVDQKYYDQAPSDKFYKNQVNIDFANQMGIKQILLLFMLQESPNHLYIDDINLKTVVFSLEKTTIILQGQKQLFEFQYVTIFHFDQIIIDEINVSWKYHEYYDREYIFSNQNSTLQLKLENVTFEGIFKFQFNCQKLEIFYAKNIEFKNFGFIDSTIFFLEFYQIYNQDIFIINIKIQNCIFLNSTVFKFINSQYNFRVQNLSIENCEFINSSVFNIETNKSENNIFFSNISVRQTIFRNSFITRSLTGKLQFINFTLTSNEFYYSKAIIASQDLQLYNIYSISNHFFQSDLINSIRDNNSNINEQTKLKNFQFQYNQIFNFKFFLSQQNPIQLQIIAQISFDQVIFEENKNIFPMKKELSIIQIENSLVQCYNIQIINSDRLQYFNLTQIQKVSFINFTMKNDQLSSTVPISLQCINFEKGITQLLNLQGFVSLDLENISIINQISIDSPFIKITSTFQFFIATEELIVVKNLYFHNNLLFKTESNIILSSFVIYSQNLQKVEFQNISFGVNIFHQIADDALALIASLIYIDSVQSYCLFKNINLLNNCLTNSSISFVLSKLIKYQQKIQLLPITMQQITNCQIKNISKNLVNQIFRSIFQIRNIGGLCQLATQKVTIINSYFHNIRGQSSAICQITTKGEGFVKILNLVVEQIMTDITLSITLFGGFGIDSFDSLLNLQIKNVTFIENINKLGSSILTIVPSQKQNKIKITDIVIRNCLSLLTSVFSFEFTGQSAAINYVKIADLSFCLDEQSWIKYFNLIQDINQFDVQKILSSNSIISVSGSEIELSNLFFTGVILGQILKTINSHKITVKFVRAYDIQQIYPDSLIYFGQNEQNSEKIIIFSSEIKNYSMYIPNNLILQQENFIFNNEYDKCKLNNDDFKIIQQNKNYIMYVDIIQKQSTSLASIIYFSTSSNQTSINIMRLNIKGNNCNQFSSALSFNLNLFDQIKISELSCTQNTFQKHGCLYFYSTSYLISPIEVKNSIFFLNKGSNGSALYGQITNLKVSDCYFMNNSVTEEGGAIIYYGKGLNFKNSYIFFNKALVGGGLATFANQFSNISQLNSVFVQFNKATFVSDNILSQPTHLAFMVNNMQMQSSILKADDQQIYQLQIKPYTTIDQQYKFKTKYLMLPSNQIISDYKELNPKSLEHIRQIFSLKLTLRNIYDEILPNSFGFSCLVNSEVSKNLEQSIQNQQVESQLQFDSLKNEFIFDKLKIPYDPYLIESNFIILEAQCHANNSLLIYQIYTKIYKCQLGEYYVENIGCQLCNSIQGYYSVKYNATKCSLFDKTKYKNITSNQIELIWRSNKYSDIIEICFKNEKVCQGGWQTGNGLCSKGHIGGLCEKCDILNMRGEGHFFEDSQNQECWDCEKSTSGLIGFSLILLWSMFSTFLTLSSVKVSNKLFSSLISMQKYGKIIFKLNQDHKGFLIKMFINHLWIFSAIFTFNITFSFQVNVVEQVSSPSVFMANSLDCLLQEFTSIQIVYFRIIVAFFLIFAQFLIIAVILTLVYAFKQKNLENSLYSNLLIYLYLQNNGSLIKQLSSLLTSRSISGVLFISGDVSLLYQTENHLNWLRYFIIPSLIVISLLIPIILLFLLLINQNKLDFIKVRKHLGYLFNEYREIKFYWELIKILKQSIIILFLILFETQILLKAIVLGCILILYQSFIAQQEPFIIKNFNKLDLQSGQLCCVSIFLAAVKFQTEQDKNDFLAKLFQVIIVFLLLKICWPFFQIITIYTKNEKILILKRILRLLKCIKNKSGIAKYLSNQIEKLETDKNNLRRNLDKIRQTFLNIQNRTLTLQQRFIRQLMRPKIFSQENNLNQGLKFDQYESSQKNEI